MIIVPYLSCLLQGWLTLYFLYFRITFGLYTKPQQFLLLELPTPKDICNRNLTKFTNLIYKASHGKYDKEKAVSLKKLAHNSIGTSDRSTAFVLQQNIWLIQSVQAEIDVLDKPIKLFLKEINSHFFTIHGICYTLAAITLIEIGDITYFSTSANLLAFAGMEPSTYLLWAVM